MSRQSIDIHADWLRLVEPEGQFLTLPVVRQAFPSGLDSTKDKVRDALRKRYPKAETPKQEHWNTWIDWLLRDVLEWGPYYRTGEDVAQYTDAIPEYGVVLRADGALFKEALRVLLMRYPHGTALDERIKGDRWNTSPIDRVKELCKAHQVRLGIVTDGQRIVLVWVPSAGAGGHATWDTSLFLESRERGLLQSFTSLLRASRFFAVQEDAQIEALFEASEKFQSEVTSQLGFQVRQAVELLVDAISKANLERDSKLLAGIPPKRVYEAAATVMMRLVFLLYAEERDLLPLSEPLYADYYAASTLREQLDEQAAIEGDEPLERRSAAWNRLLATFRVIYAGLNHDRLRLPPYGGRLFDPDRFPFLEGRTEKQKWNDAASTPLFVDDLTVRAILEAIQTLPIRENGSRERRKLSFRSLDVEQIGHVYEGLLDHGVERVDDVYLGLVGKSGDEAEIPLADVESAATKGRKHVIAFLAEKTKRSEGAIEKMLAASQDVVSGKDAEMLRLLNTACDNKRDLATRVGPFVYALRKDLHGLPVIFNTGSLVVKQTRARRDSGTEYTPRELAEEMVQYELEPLVYSPGPRDGVEPDKWKLRSSKELLDLKICDPAVGSGAFLVSACRYLADRIVEAWIAKEPQLENTSRDDLTLDARRAVVDRCLYGVDRDSMAVEMAKLSLWLITMARERPFSFLDHSIREGDSLLGITSLEQVLYAHINPAIGKAINEALLFNVAAVAKPIVERAATLRRQLESLPNISVRDAEAKQRLNDEASEMLDAVNVVADMVVGTALSTSTQSEKQRDAAFRSVALKIQGALQHSNGEKNLNGSLEPLRSLAQQFLNSGAKNGSPPRITMHWPLAFPEVFEREERGFDALIGNPPFMGGKKISGAFGTDFREYLVSTLADGRKGHADLVGYFFLRGADIGKNLAFLAADTIAQGDTREIALDEISARGWRIVRAVKSRPWPGVAGVHIAQVWAASEPGLQRKNLDGVTVADISTYLAESRRVEGKPVRLAANSGIAYNGMYALGTGFLLEPEDAQALIARNSSNADVLFPYLTAEDICSRPDGSASRWIINFHDWSLERAETYKECMKIVRERVKPQRDNIKDAYGKQYWWRLMRTRPELRNAIASFDNIIVMPIHSKIAIPMFYPNNLVYSHGVCVIAKGDFASLGILSSTVHHVWVRAYTSTLGTVTRYAPSDCFETFPFPLNADSVEPYMREIELKRKALMEQACIGLTDVYNRVSDPRSQETLVVQLRELHTAMDLEIIACYGWEDIDLKHGYYPTDEGVRWTFCDTARNEVLDRLLELNHARHREETADGAVAAIAASSGKTKHAKKASAPVNDKQMALY